MCVRGIIDRGEATTRVAIIIIRTSMRAKNCDVDFGVCFDTRTKVDGMQELSFCRYICVSIPDINGEPAYVATFFSIRIRFAYSSSTMDLICMV